MASSKFVQSLGLSHSLNKKQPQGKFHPSKVKVERWGELVTVAYPRLKKVNPSQSLLSLQATPRPQMGHKALSQLPVLVKKKVSVSLCQLFFFLFAPHFINIPAKSWAFPEEENSISQYHKFCPRC